MQSTSIDELDMTGLIPFSGLIIDILAIAALVKSFGQPLMWAVIFAWIVSSWAKNGMAEYVKHNGFDGNVKVKCLLPEPFRTSNAPWLVIYCSGIKLTA